MLMADLQSERARRGGRAAKSMMMKWRTHAGRPPPFGFTDRSQGGSVGCRTQLLSQVGLLHHKEATGADVGVRDGTGGDRCQCLIGFDYAADLRADMLFTERQQGMVPQVRSGPCRALLL